MPEHRNTALGFPKDTCTREIFHLLEAIMGLQDPEKKSMHSEGLIIMAVRSHLSSYLF